MAALGCPKAELVLSDEERQALERLVNRRMSAQAIALRARIVTLLREGGHEPAAGRGLEGEPGHGRQVGARLSRGAWKFEGAVLHLSRAVR